MSNSAINIEHVYVHILSAAKTRGTECHRQVERKSITRHTARPTCSDGAAARRYWRTNSHRPNQSRTRIINQRERVIGEIHCVAGSPTDNRSVEANVNIANSRRAARVPHSNGERRR